MAREQLLPLEAVLANLTDSINTPEYNFALHKKDIIKDLSRLLHEYEQLKDYDFREIGDHLYDGIYIADGEGNTLYVNKAYERMTGLKAEEILGKNVAECEKAGLYKNAVTPLVIKQKRQVNAMGESARSGIKMLISGNPILDYNGQVKKVVVIDRDITDLLKMREELEASQQKMQAAEADKRKKRQELEHLRKHFLVDLIGSTKEMQQIVEKIQQVAKLDVTVLITGETGTGKEVVANEIYTNSLRKNGPFIKVNCAAIPVNLLEAELFGYEKGAFTGASTSGKLGLFELADGGTLLLDEVGEMPLDLQAKLLRVIQHKEVTRIGGRKPLTLNVRILAATNCDLLTLIRQNRFREDLYYRLNVFPIHIPPLRIRTEDIEDLTRHFLSIYNTKYAKSVVIDQPGIQALKHYPWPGNIRELQNIMERLVIISDPASTVTLEQVQSLLNIEPLESDYLNTELGLKEIVDIIERKTIEKTLKQCGSTRKAAKVLKIDQSTIVKKAKKLGIQL